MTSSAAFDPPGLRWCRPVEPDPKVELRSYRQASYIMSPSYFLTLLQIISPVFNFHYLSIFCPGKILVGSSGSSSRRRDRFFPAQTLFQNNFLLARLKNRSPFIYHVITRIIPVFFPPIHTASSTPLEFYRRFKLLLNQWVWVLSKFNGTSTPKGGSYRAKTGDNDCNVNSSHYSLSTHCTVWEHSLSGQVGTKCPTRPDTQGGPRPISEKQLRIEQQEAQGPWRMLRHLLDKRISVR